MKILMVCLGNICRSPLAHGIMEHMVSAKGLDWEIDSAGTGDWHVGHAPDKRSVQVALDRGIDISHQRAQLFHRSFFSEYDHILVMDRQNYKDVISMASDMEEKNKVSLFLNDDIVPDPYYDSNMFVPVYDLIEARCKQLIEEWTEK